MKLSNSKNYNYGAIIANTNPDWFWEFRISIKLGGNLIGNTLICLISNKSRKYDFFSLLIVYYSIYLAGYRAIIVGMDPVCSESNSWMENAQVKKLSRGSTQPFYQVW